MTDRTCSYCYETGHNKSACPVRKQRIEKTRLADPENWQVYSYDRDQARLKESRERAVRNRRCSFCGEAGHNRRGCRSFKAAKQACYEANREFRPKLLDYMTRFGIAPGGLMLMSESRWCDEKRQYIWAAHQYLITGIHWQNLNFNYTQEWDIRAHLQARSVKTGEVQVFALTSEDKYSSMIERYKETGEVKTPIIISPGPLAPEPPKGWLKSAPSTANFSHRFNDKDWDSSKFEASYVFDDAAQTKTWKEFKHAEQNDV